MKDLCFLLVLIVSFISTEMKGQQPFAPVVGAEWVYNWTSLTGEGTDHYILSDFSKTGNEVKLIFSVQRYTDEYRYDSLSGTTEYDRTVKGISFEKGLWVIDESIYFWNPIENKKQLLIPESMKVGDSWAVQEMQVVNGEDQPCSEAFFHILDMGDTTVSGLNQSFVEVSYDDGQGSAEDERGVEWRGVFTNRLIPLDGQMIIPYIFTDDCNMVVEWPTYTLGCYKDADLITTNESDCFERINKATTIEEHKVNWSIHWQTTGWQINSTMETLFTWKLVASNGQVVESGETRSNQKETLETVSSGKYLLWVQDGNGNTQHISFYK